MTFLIAVPREAAAADLIADGHEFANHMPADRKDYASLGEAEFERQLCRTTAAIEAVAGAGRVRWFRAPSGRFTRTMQAVTERHGLRHALGDAYCDDWRVPGDVQWVADTMLAQAQAGSYASSSGGGAPPSKGSAPVADAIATSSAPSQPTPSSSSAAIAVLPAAPGWRIRDGAGAAAVVGS